MSEQGLDECDETGQNPKSGRLDRRLFFKTVGMGVGLTASMKTVTATQQTLSPAAKSDSSRSVTADRSSEPTNHTWQEEAKLTASDGDSEDRFGRFLTQSADGSTALIGAFRDEDPNGEEAGSAYVFRRAGGSWEEEAKLTASDGDTRDGFGFSMSLSADSSEALIGAPVDEDPNGDRAGSAYVFRRKRGSWEEEAKLTASDGDTGDGFGAFGSLSGDGSTALIGADFDEDPNGPDAGSAYVFSSPDSNSPPMADAGDTQTAEQNTTVTLDASESTDPDGDSLTYSWTQTDGPDVLLTDADTATPEFTAPDVDSDTELVFEVTVDDGEATDSETTTVSVSDSETDGPPAITGEDPPTDRDGDGNYEDVDGDGELTVADVQVFFENYRSDVIQDNAALFNFSGDDSGEVTLADVQALYQQLVA